MPVSVTVALCTHNPRAEALAATLAALQAQTQPIAGWRLVLVDNASQPPLAGRLDLSWHPAARIVVEPELGITAARRRAMVEAERDGASLLLFVDDDNVLAPDYIKRGIALAGDWPRLGAWGGQLLPRFETAPPSWIQNYLKYLAIAPLSQDRWTNHVATYDSVPPTAGAFIRPEVWRHHLALLDRDPRHLALGPKGGERVAGEDMDLMLSAIDLGLGIGRFHSLRLEHLIPAGRLTPDYVVRLVESISYGAGLLDFLRFNRQPPSLPRSALERVLHAWRTWRLPEPLRSLRRAELRGQARARHRIAAWGADASGKTLRLRTAPIAA